MDTPISADPPPPDTHPTLLQISQSRLTDLNHFLQAPHDPDPDFIHDLRVITRRLTEVARLLDPLMEKTAATALVASLRTLRQSTGDLRDLDVLSEHLHSAKLPAPLHPVRDAILASLPQRRTAYVAALQQELASPTLSASLLFLARILEESSTIPTITQETLHRALNKIIRKRRKQLKKELGKAAFKQTQEQFHAARIAVKKLRYALELADESALGTRKKELKFLKKFQAHLGDMHDADVILKTVQSQISAQEPSAPALHSWKSFQKAALQRQARAAAQALVNSFLWMNT